MGLIKTYLMTALVAVFWGANFNLAKPVVAALGPFISGASRYLIAAAIMLAITFAKHERLRLAHWKIYLVLGIVGVFGFNVFFFLGMQSTSAVNGALIMALNPLLTAIIGYFVLKDRPSNRQIIAFPVGIIGVAIVVLGAGATLELNKGDLYLLIGSLCWAYYSVLVRKMIPKEASGIASTTGILCVGAIALTALALVHGDHFILPNLKVSAALFVMAAGGGVYAYLYWNAGIAKLGPSKTAIFINLVPVTSMVISLFEGSTINAAQLIGAAMIIGAVSFSSMTLPAKARESQSKQALKLLQ